MNAEAVSPSSGVAHNPESPAGLKRPHRARRGEKYVTLQIGTQKTWLIAGAGDCQVCELPVDNDPHRLLVHAKEKAKSLLAQTHSASKPDLSRLRWRLVLEDGFQYLAVKPRGKWTKHRLEVSTAELELNCPLALEELVVAAMPVSADRAWTVALRRQSIQVWHEAARKAGIVIEGIWTRVSALVEYRLEYSVSSPLVWSDGQLQVKVDGTEKADSGLSFIQGTFPAPSDASIGLAPNAPFSPPAPLPNVPPAVYPGLCAQNLQRIDPSESFNLARGPFAAADLTARRQRPLTRACWWATAAAVLIGVAMLLSSRVSANRSAAYAVQMRHLWKQSQGSGVPDAAPLDSLVRQAAAWKNLRERGALRDMGSSQLAALSRCVNALPPDMPMSISRIRSAGGELWIDGQVRSQADARRLAESVGHQAYTSTDSLRTSNGASGTVTFSLHVVQAMHLPSNTP